jgi:ankyrin repeat protein
MPVSPAVVDAFLRSALVPRAESHQTGSLEDADRVLTSHPALARASVWAASALADVDALSEWLAGDSTLASRVGGPFGWDPLTTLCFSRYLRLDLARGDAFTVAAERLLSAGADPNSGWWNPDHGPQPTHERVLYGAAGVAQHAGVTERLLAHGADPNDDETPYHVPESYDLATMRLLLSSGRCSANTLTTMLLRKADWHDHDGMELLLSHGADPNAESHWGITPLQQSIRRDNAIETIAMLVDHGADLTRIVGGRSAIEIAAERGRADVLQLARRRGVTLPSTGVTGVLAACAMDEDVTVSASQVDDVRGIGGSALCAFAGVGNAAGVQRLLALGVAVDARGPADGYWGLASGVTALHVAAWRLREPVVAQLLLAGATVDAVDDEGHTPLMYFQKACTSSYWSERRSPAIASALLAAGASAARLSRPTGYPDLDTLLDG